MSSCLNISKEELKAYNELNISLQEVNRDYMENGVLRSPRAIRYKLDLINNEANDKWYEWNSQQETFTDQVEEYDNKTANEWLFQLSKGLNVESKVITEQEAKEIHAAKQKEYNGEIAFFAEDTVYFIEGKFTPESVVHEFSHPIIKSLPAEVRDKLYNELLADEYFQEIIEEVNELYKDGSNPESIKEEVLVRALTKLVAMEEMTPKLKTWFDKLMYQIRQALRKLLGRKVDVGKLQADTTLKGMAEMVAKGDVLELKKKMITGTDIIEYFKDKEQFIESFNKINLESEEDARFMMSAIGKVFDAVAEQKADILNNPKMLALTDVFMDELEHTRLQEIERLKEDNPTLEREDILDYFSQLKDGTIPEMAVEMQERMSNLMHTLYKVNDIFTEGKKKVKALRDLDSKTKLDTLLYFKKHMLNYEQVITDFHAIGNREKVFTEINDEVVKDAKGNPIQNPVNKLANELFNSLNEMRSEINSLQKNAVLDIFVEIAGPTADRALKKFNDEMSGKSALGADMLGAPQKVRDSAYQAFHNMTEAQYKKYKKLKAEGSRSRDFKDLHELWITGLEFDRSKAEAILDGTAQDSSWGNGMLESLSNNGDAAISSVYAHLRSMTNLYETNANSWMTGWVDTVDKHLKAGAKVSFQKRGDSGKKMGTQDTIGLIDEQGNVIAVKENMFLTPWKDYRYDQVVLNNEVTIAKKNFEESNSDADKRLWKKAKWEYQKWKNTYMNQDFDAGYYAADELLIKDDIGYEASERRDAIYDEIKELGEDNDGTNDAIIDNLKAKLKALRSTTDKFGVKKTGNELAIAERLQEYSDARAEYFLEDEIPGAFQDAYDEYSLYLEATHKIDSPKYKELMETWLRKNTKVVLKNSVHVQKQELIDEKKEILKLLDEENKKIFDDTEQQTLINEQTRIVKDSGNQPQGDISATAEARKAVLEAHKEIEKKREDLITSSGLSLTDKNRLFELRQIQKDNGGKWKNASDESEHNALAKKQIDTSSRLGLNEATLGRLKEINALLTQESIPTDFYRNTMIEFLDNTPMRTLVKEFIENQGGEFTSLEDLANDYFSEFVQSKQGEEAMKADADFKKFVDQNHYKRDDKGVKKLTPTNLWIVNQSPNPFDYKSKRIKQKDGKSKLIKVDDQYRVPSSEFQARIVKDKYETKEIIGVTKDNRGKWLPKNESTNRYRNSDYYKLKEEEPEMYQFMEDLKKDYLNGQNVTENDADKLYMSFPRTRKTRLENIVTGTVGPGRFIRSTIENVFGAEDDIFEYKEGSKDQMNQDMKSLRSYSMINTDVKMPVIGVFQGTPGRKMMNIKDQSTDIFKTIPEYIASLNHKKGAKESNSYARSMQDILGRVEVDKRNFVTQRKSKINQNANHQNLDQAYKKSQKQDNKTARSQVLDALIERDFDGITMTGLGSKNKAIQRALDATVKRSSKMNFNWNLSSGVVNYGQMKITALTHVLSGQEMSKKNFLKGDVYATRTSFKVSRDIRKRGHKSLEEQTFTLFDAISGRSMDTMGDTLSRTYIGDMLDGKASQNIRHWLELQGALQNFGGMMYEKKIKITDSKGNTTEIPYMNAFELVNGRIQTKEGVEEHYAVSYKEDGSPIQGKGFSEQKLHMQNVIMKWNGAFAKKDQALIGRYVIGKQLMFLKKHVIPIASKQYSFGLGMSRHSWLPSIRKRMNWSTGEAEWGHTISTLMVAKDFFQNWMNPRTLMYLTKSQLKGVFYTMVQIGMGILVHHLWKLLTPTWIDGDDDDREKTDWAAMQTRSGWYDGGIFGKDGLGIIRDQPGYEFNREENGFLMNHISMIAAKLEDEYNSVNWLAHSSGWNDLLNQTTSQSISLTQSAALFSEIVGLLNGNRTTTPSQDAGPFFFQEADYRGGNYLRLLFKYHGWMSGPAKMIDPTGAQKNYETSQRMKGN